MRKSSFLSAFFFFLLHMGLMGAFAAPVVPASPHDEEQILSEFSSAGQVWGKGVEALIEDAYRSSFKTYIIRGKVITVRMPFAENNERAELVERQLIVRGGGKADPQLLWPEVDSLLQSPDFQSYASLLSDGREKLITFDLDSRSWSVSQDLFSVARMKADAYPGLPHRPYIYSDGTGIKNSDVYNYIYSVGRLGMDCSGFVWKVLSTIAGSGGLDLSRVLYRSLGAPRPSLASLYFGTQYFNKPNREAPEVPDLIRNLRPLDLILFRGEKGDIVHSTVIQSIDLKEGVIRYLQSTDEAPMDERGVHESFILFEPGNDALSLKDPSLIWTQRRLAPFAGERPSAFADDGARYRAFPEHGGGKVVRIRALAKPLEVIQKRKQILCPVFRLS